MVPPGSIQRAWDNHRFTVRLVNASNKRRFKIIVVGTGLAGASRRRDAGRARLRGRGLHVPRLAAAGALDRRPGRDQRGQGLPQRRRLRSSGSSTTRSRAATSARARPTSTGSRRSRTRSSTRRPRRACRSRASTAGCSTTARSAARRSSRTFYARGQTGQQLLLGAYQAMMRQVAAGKVKLHTRTEMLDVVVDDGVARGIVVRDLLTGEVESHSAHAVVLATGGYSQRVLPVAPTPRRPTRPRSGARTSAARRSRTRASRRSTRPASRSRTTRSPS